MTLDETIECIKEVKEDYWEDDGYGYATADCQRITTALDEVMERLEQTRWIPVSERLPDKLQDVLITFYDAEGEYDVAYIRKTFNETYKAHGSENEWVSSMGETTYADYEVSAWMPLPEPYKAESEDGTDGNN